MKTKREEYRDLGKTIGEFRCVSINEYDSVIACERGEIWEVRPGVLRAYKRLNGGKTEKIFTFDIKHLKKWVLALNMPSDINMQVYYANNLNR